MGVGGGISPLGAQFVSYGGWVNFTITPDTGYYISNVDVDDSSVGTPSFYNFTDVQADHWINVSFALMQTRALPFC